MRYTIKPTSFGYWVMDGECYVYQFAHRAHAEDYAAWMNRPSFVS